MKKFLIVFLLIAAPVYADVFDDLTPGHWQAISLNTISSVGNAQTCDMSGTCTTLGGILAFSGGFYDSKRNRFCVHGGGHGDYSGNEIYCFNISTRLWVKTWPGSPSTNINPAFSDPPGGNACPGWTAGSREQYTDCNPASRHSYSGLVYMPNVDLYFVHGGSLYGGSGGFGTFTWLFNPNASTWTRAAQNTCYTASPTVPSAVYNPVTGTVWVHQQTRLCEYNPRTNTWTTRSTSIGQDYSSDHSHAVYDASRKRFCLIGNGLRCYDLTNPNLSSYTLSTITTTGDKTCENAFKPGAAYDSMTKKIVCWPQTGKDVYTLDLTTNAWTKLTAPGASATPSNANAFLDGFPTSGQTYGRFTYVPSKHVFLLVNAVNGSVYAYKLPDNVLPSGQWKAVAARIEFPIGIIGSKHLSCNFNPRDGKVYCAAGDYNGVSYLQQVWSLDIPTRLAAGATSTTGYTLEFPPPPTQLSSEGSFLCHTTAILQPKHPDFVSWIWDDARGEFWFVPGYEEGGGTDRCPGQTILKSEPDAFYKVDRVMRWSPTTKLYTDVTARSTFQTDTSSWAAILDPVTNRIIQANPGGFVSHLDASNPTTWTNRCFTTNALGGETRIHWTYLAVDRVSRYVYGLDVSRYNDGQQRLHRFSMDLPTGAGGCVVAEDLGPLPNLTQAAQTKIIWNPHAQVLMWLNNESRVTSPTGLVSFTSGSAIATGSGTQFLTQVQAGHSIGIQSLGCLRRVKSVDSNTQLTMEGNWFCASQTNGAYQIFDGSKFYAYHPTTAQWELLPTLADNGFHAGGTTLLYDETNNILLALGQSDSDVALATSAPYMFAYRYGSIGALSGDTTQPVTTITNPTSSPTFVNDHDSIILGGTCTDNTACTQVTWTNSLGGSGSASLVGTAWTSTSIPLQSGVNVITVTGRDAASNTHADQISVTWQPSDPTPPVVAITSPTTSPTHSTGATPINLSGTCTDNVACTQVTWSNDRGGSGTAALATGWTVTGLPLQPGANIITITARDAANNTHVDTITITLTTPPAAPAGVKLSSTSGMKLGDGGGLKIGVGTIIQANPSNYQALINALVAGDILQLDAGNYPGMAIFNLNGTESLPITITGPTSGVPAIILGSAGTNTVRFQNSSYVVLKNLEVDSQNLGGDGINNQLVSHHITLENLYVHGSGNEQQTVCISTNRAEAWNWIIRRNTIRDCGTGLYLGDDDGLQQFLAGTIENNLIEHTIGYNMQIKHQAALPTNVPGLPLTTTKTIIRNNVFSKATKPSGTIDGPRPNLLLGHAPATGNGADNGYEIYGNFFYENPDGEGLIQATGHLAIYNNLFFNSVQTDLAAIAIQTQFQPPKKVRVFNNTIVANLAGISISGTDGVNSQDVIGNAIFSATPMSGGTQADNITDNYANSVNYMIDPLAALGTKNFFPIAGQLTGAAIDTTLYQGLYTDWDKDFNATARTDQTFRGAYFGDTTNPGWTVNISEKP